MTARVYATEAEWLTYTGEATAPAHLDRLLRRASTIVDSLLRGRAYDVDTDGMPTDTDDTLALSDAVCAIAAEAAELGTLEPGSTQTYESVAIGSVSLSTLQGASSSDTLLVGGMPVPADAVVALSAVGWPSVAVL